MGFLYLQNYLQHNWRLERPGLCRLGLVGILLGVLGGIPSFLSLFVVRIFSLPFAFPVFWELLGTRTSVSLLLPVA